MDELNSFDNTVKEDNARETYGRNTNRVELWKVVPRSVPFSIGLSPSDICNFRCNYCNQSTEAGIKDAQILKWDNFIILTQQIEEMLEKATDDIKIIRFVGNGEPLVNKKLPEMVGYIKDRKIASRIEVTTNGSLLTHEYSDALIDAGLTRLLVSVQGTTTKKYNEICDYNMDIDKFVDQISYFYRHRKQCHLYVKTMNVALDGEKDEKKFYDTYRDISDTICVENLMNACADVDYSTITSKDVKYATRYGGDFKEKICCDTLFMYLNIHSNGDVDCCGCKYPPLYLGNLYKTPMKDLWNGKVHKSIMMKHLLGHRDDIPICSNCCSIDSFGTFPEDNLDDHLDEIYLRVEKL